MAQPRAPCFICLEELAFVQSTFIPLCSALPRNTCVTKDNDKAALRQCTAACEFILECGHAAHASCMEAYIRHHFAPCCPLCRALVSTHTMHALLAHRQACYAEVHSGVRGDDPPCKIQLQTHVLPPAPPPLVAYQLYHAVLWLAATCLTATVDLLAKVSAFMFVMAVSAAVGCVIMTSGYGAACACVMDWLAHTMPPVLVLAAASAPPLIA